MNDIKDKSITGSALPYAGELEGSGDLEGLFFELLQVAIGTRKTLSKQPTDKELIALFDLSKKQALTAIAFAGLSKYLDSLGEASPGLGTPLSRGDGGVQGVRGSLVYLKWLGLTAKATAE